MMLSEPWLNVCITEKVHCDRAPIRTGFCLGLVIISTIVERVDLELVSLKQYLSIWKLSLALSYIALRNFFGNLYILLF